MLPGVFRFDLGSVMKLVRATVEDIAFKLPFANTSQDITAGPALWWVKDAGIYLLGNGVHAQRAPVYAVGAGADHHVGADGFIEPIDLDDVLIEELITGVDLGHRYLRIISSGSAYRLVTTI
jgi:hypothetical protein